MKNLIELFSACLSPVIAIWALLYTHRQWKLEKQKIQLELYDRRFKVFEEVKKFLSVIAHPRHPLDFVKTRRFKTSF